ncbi:MAG TPA: dihydropteroate synthase [Kofleriaceae bacterium]
MVNVTPDSFSDGDPDPGAAIEHGLALLADGADLLDVGGEATNPRARPVGADEELARVLPVVTELARHARVSIDTTKAEVARAAIRAGATIVNDVSGGLFDPAMRDAIAQVTYICGHLRGRSLTEVFREESRPVAWQEVAAELAERIATLPAGADVWVDPGLGFGKGGDPTTNEQLVLHAGDLGRALGGRPVVVGPSRKRYLRRRLIEGGIGDPTEADLDRATVEACVAAARAGANVLRVHNVALLRAGLIAYTKL